MKCRRHCVREAVPPYRSCNECREYDRIHSKEYRTQKPYVEPNAEKLSEKLREAGKKGGSTHSREHMREIGRKGGRAVQDKYKMKRQKFIVFAE